MKHPLMRVGVFSVFLFLPVAVQCVTPGKWVTTSRDDFDKGKLENVCVEEPGNIVLAPRPVEMIEEPLARIWCMVSNSSGSIYAGACEGIVLKLEDEQFIVMRESDIVAVLSK